LSGAFTLSLTSDGISHTPVSGMAYSFTDDGSASCTSEPVKNYAGTYSDIWIGFSSN